MAGGTKSSDDDRTAATVGPQGGSADSHAGAAREPLPAEATILDPSRTSASQDTAAAPEVEVGAKSVLVALDTSGKVGSAASVRLRRLSDEAATEVARGRERYTVLSPLGEGGMGKVLLVADRDLKRRVAMKVMLPQTRAHTSRFLEEAQILGQLEHPNIVPLYDMGLTGDEQPYSTMRYVRGHTLEEVIGLLRSGDGTANREYSLTRLMQIFQQIVQAVSYAHAKGVVHRDLKPANVMLGEHGEVQVLDWGLAKVLDRAEAPSSQAVGGTGHVMGTWAYMPPEQALGEEVDERADVYSLGVILYELLTLTRPITGKSPTELRTALLTQAPPLPRARAPGRNIPVELEEVCLRALEKQREERLPSARALLGAVQDWVEASADKAKRHQRAEAKVREGRAELEEYGRLKTEVKRLTREADEVATRFEPWQPAAEKADLIAAQDRAREVQRRLVVTATTVVGRLSEALGFEEDNATARELLADYYWDHCLQAEERFSEDDRAYYGGLVALYHDGKYARELRGDGSLTLTSEPAGAEVWLHTIMESGFVLIEGKGRQLGTTPLDAATLAMGSYVAVLRKAGLRDVRYPVHITRNREWSGSVRLYADDPIGRGFVYVPGGPCVVGGDAEAQNSWPRREVVVDDFAIAEHPVTLGEYLEFANEVAVREGLDAARLRSPRRAFAVASTCYLVEDGTGGLMLPGVDEDGDGWDPRQPATGISWHDAVAYCAWRSARDGQAYRLPTEEEWEKAARGVDGRWFPWGWRFDASLCNMRESRRERTSLVTVDEYPTDVSVYGVRGLGGNAFDWTSSEQIEGTGGRQRVARVFRGGSWSNEARRSRAARRAWDVPTWLNDGLGFRLARSLP